MQELLQELVNWLKTSGFTEFITIGNLGATITLALTLFAKLKKSNIKEIASGIKAQQVSKEYAETSKEIAILHEEQKVLNETIDRLSGMLLIVLNNSKIPSDAKQQALNVMNATSEKAKVVVKTVSEVVDEVKNVVKETVKEQVENKVEENPYISTIEKLIEK